MSSDVQNTITVEVAYALPDKQNIVVLQVEPGTTALDAVKVSGITKQFPDIDLETAKFGIFANVLGAKGLAPANEYSLQAGDRVEIYRPLIADPKEVRKQRAAKKQA